MLDLSILIRNFVVSRYAKRGQRRQKRAASLNAKKAAPPPLRLRLAIPDQKTIKGLPIKNSGSINQQYQSGQEIF